MYKKYIKNLNSKITLNIIFIIFYTLVAKIVGAGKEILVAYKFGVSDKVDAFQFVQSIILFPIDIWLSALIIVLVPLEITIFNSSRSEALYFRREFFGFSLLISFLLILLYLLFIPIIIDLNIIKLSTSLLINMESIYYYLLVLLIFGIFTSLFSSWNLTFNNHLNTLFQGIPALIIIFCILTTPSVDIISLIIGTILGYMTQLIFLAILLNHYKQLIYPKFSFNSPHWKIFINNFNIILFANTLSSFSVILDNIFASSLGIGSISLLNYSNRILGLIIGLGAISIIRITLPLFAQKSFDNKEQLYKDSIFWYKIVFLIGFIITFFLWLTAPLLVSLTYERGSFTENNTNDVVEIFRMGIIQIPFYFSSIVLISLLASLGKYKFIALLAILNNLPIKIFANYFLIPHYGILALMISNCIMYLSSMLIILIYIRVNWKL